MSGLRALAVVVALLSAGGGAAAHTGHIMWSSTSVFSPDGPLFLLQRVLDGWEELIAFDPVDKARVRAKVAHNRLAEAEAMLAKREDEAAARLVQEAAEHRAQAAAFLERAEAELERERDEQRARARRDAIGGLRVRLALNADHARSCCVRTIRP